VGDRVTFTVASLPEETFTARVSFIDPLIDPATRTASVRAEVTNRGGKLKPEMFITGTVYPTDNRSRGQGSADEVLTVPKTAVLWTGERSVVYVEVPDVQVPTYQFREVTLGGSLGDAYRVVAGLEAGEKVISNGLFSVDAAAQLRNQSSMMNRDVIIRGRESEQVTALALPDYREETPEAFRAQLGRVVEAYLLLKDGMVSSELAEKATTEAIDRALDEVDGSLLDEAPRGYWTEQLSALKAHLGGVAGAKNLEEQRRQFGFLSQALINTLTAFGAEEEIMVQHCPMAFSGAGANWLSREEAIRNPYYGDAMLTCGATTETLTP